MDSRRHTAAEAVERNRHDWLLVLERRDTGALAGAVVSVDTVVDRWMELRVSDRRADYCSSTMVCCPLGCRKCCSDRSAVRDSGSWERCDGLGLIEVDLVAITVC